MGTEAFLRVGIDGTAAEIGARIVKRSLQDISVAAKETTNDVGRIKQFFNDLGFSSQGLYRSIVSLAGAFALLSIAKAILNGIVDSFKFAFNAVEDFKINVASMSAVIMTFMERTKTSDLSSMWKEANAYARYMIPTLELISAKMLITGQQATMLFIELTKGRIAMDASNKAAVAGFVSLGNAIAILTKGQDPERQIMTETRALMTGTAQAGSMLVRLVNVLDPMYKSHLKTWRETDTALEHFGDLLSGFNAASEVLSNTWTAISTTIKTLTVQIMRGGMSEAYDSIISSSKSVREFLIEHRDILMQGIYRGWLSIHGILESIGNLLKPFSPLFFVVADLINKIAYGLGIVASVILPVITEGIGNWFQLLMDILPVFGHLLDAASEAMHGRFGSAVDKLKLMKGDFSKLGTDFGIVFGDKLGDEVVKRFSQFNKDFNTNLAPVKPPKFSPMEPDEDKTLRQQNQLAEVKMKDKLALIKHYLVLENEVYDDQFKNGLMSANSYYESRASIVMKDSKAEIDAIADQIKIAQGLQAKLRVGVKENTADLKANPIADAEELSKRLDGLDAQKGKILEFDVKIAQYRAEQHKVGMKEEADLLKLYLQKLTYMKQEYDFLHQNDDLRNQVENLKVVEDPYTSQLNQIEQRYKKEIDLATWLYEKKKELGIASTMDSEKIDLLEKARLLELNEFKKKEYERGAESLASSLDTIGQVLMKGNKEQFESGKKMAIASALIDTYLGATRAYTSLAGIPYVGVALGIAAAAAAIVAGLDRVNTIKSQQYEARALGGPVNAGGTYLVGEKGPEIVQMGSAGSVISNHELAMSGKAQLDATNTLIDAVHENTAAVTKVADGLTKIDGMLGGFVGIFKILAVSLTSMPVALKEGIFATLSSKTEGQLVSLLGNKMGGIFDKFSSSFAAGPLNWAKSLTEHTGSLIFGGKQSLAGQGISLGYGPGGVQGSMYTETHTSSGLFSHGHNDTSSEALPTEFLKMLKDNVTLLKDSIINAAAAMGQGADGINSITLSMEQINLKDLSPEEQTKAIESWFQKLADAFSSGIAGLDAVTKPGEDSFTALVRLSEALQAVNENAQKFGSTLLNLSVINADFSSQLIDKMGGMDEYLSKTSSFFEKFYSSGEQARIKAELGAKTAGDAFRTLGMVMPNTSEGFRNIVSSLDLTTESGRNAYAAIMNIASAANDVYAQDKKKIGFINDLTSRRLSASGQDVTASLFDLKAKQLAEYVDDVATYGQAFVDSMGLAQLQSTEYANAVSEAAKTISKAANKLKDDLSKAIDKQLTIAQTIVDIMSGPMATLSPKDAYDQARASFEHAQVAGNEAELPNAVKMFLEASQAYNASGPAYQQDLQDGLDALGATTLEAAQDQVTILTNIKDAITTMDVNLLNALQDKSTASGMTVIAGLMQQFISALPNSTGGTGSTGTVPNPVTNPVAQFRTAQWATEGSLKVLRMVVDPSTYAYDAQYDVIKDNVLDRKDQMELLRMGVGLSPLPAYARGGLANGWSMVGEDGPEIVNFSNPTRVYSADQTRSALGGDNKGIEGKLDIMIAKLEAMEKRLASIETKARLVKVA